MIEVDVEDYCQECRYFEADVHKCIMESLDLERYAVITVQCKNSDRCRALVNYLERRIRDKD